MYPGYIWLIWPYFLQLDFPFLEGMFSYLSSEVIVMMPEYLAVHLRLGQNAYLLVKLFNSQHTLSVWRLQANSSLLPRFREWAAKEIKCRELSSLIPVSGGNKATGHMVVTRVIKVLSACGDVRRQAVSWAPRTSIVLDENLAPGQIANSRMHCSS